MSTITSTTRIRSEKDVTDKTDLSQHSPCKHCGQKPRVIEIKWGKRGGGLLAKCCSFNGWLCNWERFNKPDDATAAYLNRASEIIESATPSIKSLKCSNGHDLEYSIWSARVSWCETCKMHDYQIAMEKRKAEQN